MHVLTMTIAYLLTINCIWLTDIIQWNLSTQGKIMYKTTKQIRTVFLNLHIYIKTNL